jgi:type II secretory pathway component GspD/PulD (secretin)
LSFSPSSTRVARVTGIPFLFDPDPVKGKIMLVAPGEVTPARALELLRSALALHGYALVGRAEAMWIVPARETAESVVMQVVPLTYASADEVAFTLSWMAPPGVRIAPHHATNSVVVSGPAAAVERLVTIVRGR